MGEIMFGFVKELDLEITCFTIAGIWYDRFYWKGKETNWMKREKRNVKDEQKSFK